MVSWRAGSLMAGMLAPGGDGEKRGTAAGQANAARSRRRLKWSDLAPERASGVPDRRFDGA